MRYLGGKARVSKPLTDFLKSVRKTNQTYVEPFVGGGSVIRLMDGQRIASDFCPYLITFYKQLQNGWLPPEIISEERYKELKQLYKETVCNGEIGFAMYFCSFGGKAWGGYARDKKGVVDNRLINGQYRDSVKLQKDIKDVTFICYDYETLFKWLEDIKSKCLIYCDPPYKGTTEYKNKFDHVRFWKVMREYSTIHDIYISEYVAPEDFECVWSIERKTNLNIKNGGKSNRVEKLFKYEDNK